VSEYILVGTSAQLGYTVPFISSHLKIQRTGPVVGGGGIRLSSVLCPANSIGYMAAGRGGEGGMRPWWHCAGAAFVGIRKFGFWQISVCTAERIRRFS